MTADSINQWLTLGANFGVLIAIILLLVELDQSATKLSSGHQFSSFRQLVKEDFRLDQTPKKHDPIFGGVSNKAYVSMRSQ